MERSWGGVDFKDSNMMSGNDTISGKELPHPFE